MLSLASLRQPVDFIWFTGFFYKAAILGYFSALKRVYSPAIFQVVCWVLLPAPLPSWLRLLPLLWPARSSFRTHCVVKFWLISQAATIAFFLKRCRLDWFYYYRNITALLYLLGLVILFSPVLQVSSLSFMSRLHLLLASPLFNSALLLNAFSCCCFSIKFWNLYSANFF